jgi:hypothetical protein
MSKTKNTKPNFVYGFTTDKGLLLDLDNTTLADTRKIAKKYCNRFKLEGFLILKSSQNNYHVVFNKYLTWKKTIEYLFKIVWTYHYHKHGSKPSLTSWAILQACKKSMTLRISNKKHKKAPRYIEDYGKTDKLIDDYCGFRIELEKQKQKH